MCEIKFRAIYENKIWEIITFSFHDREINFVDIWDGERREQVLGRDIILEQFIGLNDKNGRDIYEGDILYTAQGSHCEIRNGKNYSVNGEWHIVKESKWGGSWEPCSSGETGHNMPNVRPEWEVVGNIHENPDLLNKVELYN